MALLLSLSLFLFLARIGQPPHYAAYPSWPVIKAVSHFYETKKRELSNKYIYPSLWGDGEQRSRSGVVHLLNVEIYIRDGNFFLSLPLVSRKLSARRSTDRRDTQNRCILMARARLSPPFPTFEWHNCRSRGEHALLTTLLKRSFIHLFIRSMDSGR